MTRVVIVDGQCRVSQPERLELTRSEPVGSRRRGCERDARREVHLLHGRPARRHRGLVGELRLPPVVVEQVVDGQVEIELAEAAAGHQVEDQVALGSQRAVVVAGAIGDAASAQRDERRAKRGGGKVLAVGTYPSDDELVAIVGSEPSETFAEQLADEFRRLIDALPDEEYRRIAVLKLEGQSTTQISAALGLNERRVQRRLKVIYATWREELSK